MFELKIIFNPPFFNEKYDVISLISEGLACVSLEDDVSRDDNPNEDTLESILQLFASQCQQVASNKSHISQGGVDYAKFECKTILTYANAKKSCDVTVFIQPSLNDVISLISQDVLCSPSPFVHLLYLGSSLSPSGAWLLSDDKFHPFLFFHSLHHGLSSRKEVGGSRKHLNLFTSFFSKKWQNSVKSFEDTQTPISGFTLTMNSKKKELDVSISQCLFNLFSSKCDVEFIPMQLLNKEDKSVISNNDSVSFLLIESVGLGTCLLFSFNDFHLLYFDSYKNDDKFFQLVRSFKRIGLLIVPFLCESNFKSVVKLVSIRDTPTDPSIIKAAIFEPFCKKGNANILSNGVSDHHEDFSSVIAKEFAANNVRNILINTSSSSALSSSENKMPYAPKPFYLFKMIGYGEVYTYFLNHNAGKKKTMVTNKNTSSAMNIILVYKLCQGGGLRRVYLPGTASLSKVFESFVGVNLKELNSMSALNSSTPIKSPISFFGTKSCDRFASTKPSVKDVLCCSQSNASLKKDSFIKSLKHGLNVESSKIKKSLTTTLTKRKKDSTNTPYDNAKHISADKKKLGKGEESFHKNFAIKAVTNNEFHKSLKELNIQISKKELTRLQKRVRLLLSTNFTEDLIQRVICKEGGSGAKMLPSSANALKCQVNMILNKILALNFTDLPFLSSSGMCGRDGFNENTICALIVIFWLKKFLRVEAHEQDRGKMVENVVFDFMANITQADSCTQTSGVQVAAANTNNNSNKEKSVEEEKVDELLCSPLSEEVIQSREANLEENFLTGFLSNASKLVMSGSGGESDNLLFSLINKGIQSMITPQKIKDITKFVCSNLPSSLKFVISEAYIETTITNCLKQIEKLNPNVKIFATDIKTKLKPDDDEGEEVELDPEAKIEEEIVSDEEGSVLQSANSQIKNSFVTLFSEVVSSKICQDLNIHEKKSVLNDLIARGFDASKNDRDQGSERNIPRGLASDVVACDDDLFKDIEEKMNEGNENNNSNADGLVVRASCSLLDSKESTNKIVDGVSEENQMKLELIERVAIDCVNDILNDLSLIDTAANASFSEKIDKTCKASFQEDIDKSSLTPSRDLPILEEKKDDESVMTKKDDDVVFKAKKSRDFSIKKKYVREMTKSFSATKNLINEVMLNNHHSKASPKFKKQEAGVSHDKSVKATAQSPAQGNAKQKGSLAHGIRKSKSDTPTLTPSTVFYFDLIQIPQSCNLPDEKNLYFLFFQCFRAKFYILNTSSSCTAFASVCDILDAFCKAKKFWPEKDELFYDKIVFLPTSKSATSCACLKDWISKNDKTCEQMNVSIALDSISLDDFKSKDSCFSHEMGWLVNF